ncbi:hypothetical protein Avbf_12795 [Armadillidium vulgare]|nr:hypothetical protein Avbf_12795 [Armadillidium vulgare]
MVYVTYKVSETLAKINKSQKLSEAQNQEWFIKVLNSSISSKKEHSNRGKLSTSEFTRKVFKLLSSEEKNRLRKAYFLDLKLFNYDPYEFD